MVWGLTFGLSANYLEIWGSLLNLSNLFLHLYNIDDKSHFRGFYEVNYYNLC